MWKLRLGVRLRAAKEWRGAEVSFRTEALALDFTQELLRKVYRSTYLQKKHGDKNDPLPSTSNAVAVLKAAHDLGDVPPRTLPLWDLQKSATPVAGYKFIRNVKKMDQITVKYSSFSGTYTYFVRFESTEATKKGLGEFLLRAVFPGTKTRKHPLTLALASILSASFHPEEPIPYEFERFSILSASSRGGPGWAVDGEREQEETEESGEEEEGEEKEEFHVEEGFRYWLELRFTEKDASHIVHDLRGAVQQLGLRTGDFDDPERTGVLRNAVRAFFSQQLASDGERGAANNYTRAVKQYLLFKRAVVPLLLLETEFKKNEKQEKHWQLREKVAAALGNPELLRARASLVEALRQFLEGPFSGFVLLFGEGAREEDAGEDEEERGELAAGVLGDPQVHDVYLVPRRHPEERKGEGEGEGERETSRDYFMVSEVQEKEVKVRYFRFNDGKRAEVVTSIRRFAKKVLAPFVALCLRFDGIPLGRKAVEDLELPTEFVVLSDNPATTTNFNPGLDRPAGKSPRLVYCTRRTQSSRGEKKKK